MNHGSLFSGIGGFDLAAEWMGWTNKFHCEWNPFGQKVLQYYWPEAESYSDITKTDFTLWRGKIDILTGGFPCQPYSTAGKRLGKEDDRHLWPEMLRAIREIQPRYVVGENVSGLINWNGGMVFEEVQAELEAEGYEVRPFILPACAVNAPHRRDRIWFVAHAASNRWKWTREGFETKEGQQQGPESTRIMEGRLEGLCKQWTSTDTDSRKHEERMQASSGRPNRSENQSGLDNRTERSGSEQSFADTGNEQLQRSQFHRGIGSEREIKAKSRQFSRSIRTAWDQFPTQSPVCSRNDGISSRLDGITFSKWRNESIKAGGNAIVPQVAYQIFRAINEFEKLIAANHQPLTFNP